MFLFSSFHSSQSSNFIIHFTFQMSILKTSSNTSISSTKGEEDTTRVVADFDKIVTFLDKYQSFHNNSSGETSKLYKFWSHLKPLTEDTIANFMQSFYGSPTFAHQSLGDSRSIIEVMEKQCLTRHSNIMSVIQDDQRVVQLLEELEFQEENRRNLIDILKEENENSSEVKITVEGNNILLLKPCLDDWNKRLKMKQKQLHLEELCFQAIQRLRTINDRNIALVRNWRPVPSVTSKDKSNA